MNIGSGFGRPFVNLRLPVKEGLINEMLPPELFDQILSYLDGKSMQSTTAVSRHWNLSVKQTEIFLIKKFAKLLDENLKKEPHRSQIKSLFNIGEFNAINLIEIKSFKVKLKSDLINILKELEEEDLILLEKTSKKRMPILFDDLFELARIYKRIDLAKAMSDDFEKEKTLEKISLELMQLRHFDKAITVANMLTFDLIKWGVFNCISAELLELENFDKAIAVANMISSAHAKGKMLMTISDKLANSGNFDKAIAVANMIPDDDIKNNTLEMICNLLVEYGMKAKAEELVETISCDIVRARIIAFF